ncbi:MAG: Gfo/Idh/MocA family oxidoreductase, partial [Acidobacteria bacterium]|nr:Gfo/Idh/MocA family oxidoreductase [Acidobacteriota bacterium]
METLSRRNFIAAGATVMSLDAAAYNRVIGANDRLRIGIIGCGGMAGGHMRALVRMKEAENIEVASVCDLWDVRAEDASKITGGKVVKGYKNLLADKDIDYILNATPEHWHAQITLDAADAGKHVYCEKP